MQQSKHGVKRLSVTFMDPVQLLLNGRAPHEEELSSGVRAAAFAFGFCCFRFATHKQDLCYFYKCHQGVGDVTVDFSVFPVEAVKPQSDKTVSAAAVVTCVHPHWV